jgi:hypothetical protein
MASTIELSEYLRAEREYEAKQARTGLIVHSIITGAVGVALILDQRPRRAGVPVVGVRRIDRAIAERQDRIVASAQRRAA